MVVHAVNVPVVKFKIDKVSVDLAYAEFKSPVSNSENVSEDYFTHSCNLNHHDHKALDCMNGYLMMHKLLKEIKNFDH